MPADIQPEWVAALRQVTGCATDTIRWNGLVSRYEVILAGADGVPRSQFWGAFYRELPDGTRQPLAPDPVTGLYPFRELDDAAMREILENLQRTFVGNPWDGAGSPRREILRRMRANRAAGARHYDRLGTEYADRFLDRVKRMRGEPLVPVGLSLRRDPNAPA
jgi:hypothetical protein